MIYGVVESTNARSTHYAERILDAVCASDVENGMFGHLEELVDGHTHIYTFVAGAPTDGSPVVIVDQPAWDEDECRRSNQRRDKFYIPAGMPFRVRVVKETDEYAFNIMAFAEASRDKVEAVTDFVGTPVYVTIGDDGKLVASDAATDGTVMQGRIMRKRMVGDVLVTDVRTYGYNYALYTAKITALA